MYMCADTLSSFLFVSESNSESYAIALGYAHNTVLTTQVYKYRIKLTSHPARTEPHICTRYAES